MRITLYVVTVPLTLALTLAWLPPDPHLAGQARPQEWPERVLDGAHHHLGDDQTPEWTEAPAAPEGTRLELVFEAEANQKERVLVVDQRHVSDEWSLIVNEVTVALLRRHEDRRRVHYPLPAGALHDGENRILFLPRSPSDDVVLGDVRLIEATFRELFDLHPLAVRVVDADTDAPSPARVTVVAADDEQLAPVYYGETSSTAVREGIVYTSSGEARFELPAGRYKLFATRGSEWGLGVAQVTVPAPEGRPEPDGRRLSTARLDFRREVDTTGFVAVDTHVHTYTFSGHGDATVDERLVTLAGEGVELAVATDHDHNTDYRPGQARLGLGAHFTSVVGNEVTTKNGHFNAFPLDPEDEVPDSSSSDWVAVVEGIRAHGARVVILNHPRWPDHAKGPYGVFGLDELTGARASGTPFLFDAMELVNADTREDQPFRLVADWFSLLDRGERILAVGSSDSHTVGRPVGQGRTYVASSTDDPAAIDVDEICDNLLAGRASLGMGIFVDVRVDGEGGLGDTVPVRGGGVDVSLRVASPSWVKPTEARLYVNGVEVARQPVEAAAGPTDRRLDFRVELAAAHDAWLVAIVTGDPVAGPWWPLANGYTLAATNPVRLDGDGDGAWQSPRETARARLAARVAADALDGALADLDACDETVALHYLDLLDEHWGAEARVRLHELGTRRAGSGERLQRWLQRLPDGTGTPAAR